MRFPLPTVIVLIAASASFCAAEAPLSDFERGLVAAQSQALDAFLTHQPGGPVLDSVIRLPPPPSDPTQAARRGKLEKALRDGREVQEGCAQPCAAEADVALYLEKVRLAADGLGMKGPGIKDALEHYAPRRVPRQRAGSGPAAASALDAKALDALMSRRDVSPAARKAFGERAARIAAELDQRKGPESLGGGSAVADPGRNLSAAERARLIENYRNAPAGDSSRLRTLKTLTPPPPPESATTLTRMEKLALWVDDKVGSENIQKASNFSAGFGDSLSFGATNWVRDKMGTNGHVDQNSNVYVGGTMSAVAVSLFIGGGAILKPFNAGAQQVARWAPAAAADGGMVLKQGQFVMAGVERGAGGVWNWLKAGGPELAAKHGGRYMKSSTTSVPGNLLRYPIAEEGRVFGVIKGMMGQRIYTGPTVGLL